TLSGYYAMHGGAVSPAVLAELSDDLNTPAAIVALRALHARAKRGTLDDHRDFAASCRLLGLRSLNSPGYFQFGVSGLNVEKATLLASEDEMTKYRAAVANGATRTSAAILESLRSKGLGVRVDAGDYFSVTPFEDDLDARVGRLITARAAA